uniref:Protein kinase domain-containing protein n=1 Tax=Panagrolaimus sp. JU765 TaxID=591449 RepID=A0AC34QGK8_9BILA
MGRSIGRTNSKPKNRQSAPALGRISASTPANAPKKTGTKERLNQKSKPKEIRTDSESSNKKVPVQISQNQRERKSHQPISKTAKDEKKRPSTLMSGRVIGTEKKIKATKEIFTKVDSSKDKHPGTNSKESSRRLSTPSRKVTKVEPMSPVNSNELINHKGSSKESIKKWNQVKETRNKQPREEPRRKEMKRREKTRQEKEREREREREKEKEKERENEDDSELVKRKKPAPVHHNIQIKRVKVHKNKEQNVENSSSTGDDNSDSIKRRKPKELIPVVNYPIIPKSPPHSPPRPPPEPPIHLKTREENEQTDVEADSPASEKARVFVRTGGRLSIANKTYEVADGCVMGDYGSCRIQETETKEYFTLRYETMATTCKRIKTECTILVLAAATKRSHITRLVLRGSIDNFQLKFVITEALGETLPELLRSFYNEHFSLKTALKLAYETLDCIEDIHKIGMIHRDIKPGSFAFGFEKPANSNLYVTNLGLTKKFRTAADLKVIPARKRVPFFGTVRYASRSAHERKERSRKDDLESWFFMACEFIEEQALSWRKSSNKQEIYDQKVRFFSDDGFADAINKFNVIPDDFRVLMHYVMNLEFDSNPDYTYMKKTIKDAMDKQHFELEEPWEWLSNDFSKKQLSAKKTKLRTCPTMQPESNKEELIPVDPDDLKFKEVTCMSTQKNYEEESKKDD